jgi:hypothetical protein
MSPVVVAVHTGIASAVARRVTVRSLIASFIRADVPRR